MQVEVRLLRSMRVLIVTVVLGGLLFAVYYVLVFDPLYRFYTQAFYQTHLADPVAGLNVRVAVPLHISPLARRWVYLAVRNDSGQAVEDLRLSVEWRPGIEGGASSSDGVLLLPHLFGEQVIADGLLRFERVEPHSVVSGRIPIYVTRDVTFTIRMSSAGSPSEGLAFGGGAPLRVSVDTPRYLVHSLLEHVLLPPWSNGFLIVAALIVCGIVDGMDIDETVYTWRGWLLSVLWVLLRSARFIAYLLVAVVTYIGFRYYSFLLWSLVLLTVTRVLWRGERQLGGLRACHMKTCELLREVQ